VARVVWWSVGVVEEEHAAASAGCSVDGRVMVRWVVCRWYGLADDAGCVMVVDTINHLERSSRVEVVRAGKRQVTCHFVVGNSRLLVAKVRLFTFQLVSVRSSQLKQLWLTNDEPSASPSKWYGHLAIPLRRLWDEKGS
jgi:hypothetical protein